MDITSVKHLADKFNEKGYNMRTNRLSSTNGSTNALNLICYQIDDSYDDNNKLKPKNP